MPVVTLEVGERRFKCNQFTLTQASAYFRGQFSGPWATPTDGAYFIDRDGDLFQHLLGCMRSEIYPIFHDIEKGHDHVQYHRLLAEAKYFQIHKLVNWLEGKKYLHAIDVQKSIRMTEGAEWSTTKGTPDIVECSTKYIKDKVHICPSGKDEHRGKPSKCATLCTDTRKENEKRYEEEMVLKTVHIVSNISLDGNVLDSNA